MGKTTNDTDIMDMTLTQLRAFRKELKPAKMKCKAILLVPMISKHESGYRNIKVIAVGENNMPLGVITEISDDIRLDGVGGIRYSNSIHSGWAIDCLPKSGVMRLHGPNSIEFGNPWSSIDIFGSPE